MPYNPHEYWLERGKSYLYEKFPDEVFRIQEQFIIEALKPLSFSSVLEVGCGFGRVTKLVLANYHKISSYTATDLTPDQIRHAKKYVDGNFKVDFQVSDILSLKPQARYDLVLAAEVLLHIPQEEIRTVITKLLSLTDKYFVHIDWWEETKPAGYPEGTWNFIHDYERIYAELGVKYTRQRIKVRKSPFKTIDARQALFVVKVR
jgi:SAM-dependent methyltransferase